MAGELIEESKALPDVAEEEEEVAAEAGGDLVLASDKGAEETTTPVTEPDTAPAKEEAAPAQEKGATKDPVEPVKAAVVAKDPVEPAKASGKGVNVDPIEISSRAASEHQKYLASVAAMGNRRMIDILAQRARKSAGKDQSFQTVSMALSIISSHYADEISKENFPSQYGTMLNCYANLYRSCDMYLQGGSRSSSRLRGRGSSADMQNTKYAMQAMEVARQDVTTIRNQGSRLAQRAEPITWGAFFGEAAAGALQRGRDARAQMGQNKAQAQQVPSATAPQNQAPAQSTGETSSESAGESTAAKAKSAPKGVSFLSGHNLVVVDYWLRDCIKMAGETEIVPEALIKLLGEQFREYNTIQNTGTHEDLRFIEWTIEGMCKKVPESTVLAKLSKDCRVAHNYRQEKKDETFISSDKLKNGSLRLWVERGWLSPEIVDKLCDNVRKLEGGHRYGMDSQDKIKLIDEIIEVCVNCPQRDLTYLKEQCERILGREKKQAKKATVAKSGEQTENPPTVEDVAKDTAKDGGKDTAKGTTEGTAKKAKSLPKGVSFLSGHNLVVADYWLRDCIKMAGETEIVPEALIKLLGERFREYNAIQNTGTHEDLRFVEWTIEGMCKHVPESAVLAKLSKDCKVAEEYRQEKLDETFISSDKLKNGSLKLWVERGWLSEEIVQNLCDNVRKLEGGHRYGMDPQEKIKLINEIIEVCDSCPQRDLTYLKEQCERMLGREKKQAKKATAAMSSE